MIYPDFESCLHSKLHRANHPPTTFQIPANVRVTATSRYNPQKINQSLPNGQSMIASIGPQEDLDNDDARYQSSNEWIS